jgi:hypothetical protein
MTLAEELIGNGNNMASSLIDKHVPELYRPLAHRVRDNVTSTLHNIRKDRLMRPLHSKIAASTAGLH